MLLLAVRDHQNKGPDMVSATTETQQHSHCRVSILCASIVLRVHRIANEAHYCKTLVRQASWVQPL
jgi:hypothetical protein